MNRYSVLGIALAVVGICAGSGRAAGSVQSDLLSMTGGQRVKVVWAQEPNRVCGYDTSTGYREPIFTMGGSGNAARCGRPFVTQDGTKIVFSTGFNSTHVGDFGLVHKVHIVNWDGSGYQQIASNGYLCQLWTDANGREWAIWMNSNQSDYYRYPIDGNGSPELVWDCGGSGRADLQPSMNFQYAAHSRGSGHTGVIRLSNGSEVVGRGGCRASMCPDNSYYWSHFQSTAHTDIEVGHYSASSGTNTIVKSALSLGGKSYFPRWCGHPRMFGWTQGVDGQPGPRVLIGHFNTSFNGWVKTVIVKDGSNLSHPWARAITSSPTPQVSVDSFTASPTSIVAGGSSTLSWQTSNATSVSISGVGTVGDDGSTSVSPTATTTYTLTAQGDGGPVTAQVTVNVSQPATVSIDAFNASPATIAQGASATLTWQTSEATSVSVDNGVGAVSADGSTSVSPVATTTYTITAQGNGGPVTAQATVTVTPAGGGSGSELRVSSTGRYLVKTDGTPFFWCGDTAWGLFERPTREEVDAYLDDRAAKGFTVVQACAFWGKRLGSAGTFFVNPENAYGHRAFAGGDTPDTSSPLVVAGGSPTSPNDFWDNVDYVVEAARTRGIYVALLPVWARRYVNATHSGNSYQCFTVEQMRSYGQFIADRYKDAPHIIWVMGGDVTPTNGAGTLEHFRAMAEGVVTGVTGQAPAWDEAHAAWDEVLLTYHPPGNTRSSTWFHNDGWLDLNWVQTNVHPESVYPFIAGDYDLTPVKPTVFSEGAYEGNGTSFGTIDALMIRRQAYHALLAGAAGQTYGCSLGDFVWTFYGDWATHLSSPGALSIAELEEFMTARAWHAYVPDQGIIMSGLGADVTRKVATKSAAGDEALVYFASNSAATIAMDCITTGASVDATWVAPASGATQAAGSYAASGPQQFTPPSGWADAILVLSASGSPPPPPQVSIDAFTASASTVAAGDAVTLTWETSNASAVSIDDGVGAVADDGSVNVTPAVTTTYTLTAQGDGGPATATATVVVLQPGDVHIKVNAGSNDHDVAGWERDDAYVSEGEDYVWGQATDTSTDALAAPAEVYRSVRHQAHSYSFASVPDGAYEVRIHFVEGGTGSNRAMDYTIEGTLMLDDFQITSEVGTYQALVKVLSVTVADGNGLQIECSVGSGNDVFEAGIEVITDNSTPGPTPNEPPSATAAASPTVGAAPLTVDFTGTGSDTDGSVTAYAWAFADGGTSAQQSPSHTFVAAGEYAVVLTVTDDDGATAQATTTVTVTSVEVVSPNGGEDCVAGTVRTIDWIAEYITEVSIAYSTDSGSSWVTIAASVTDGDVSWGAYPWTVPDEASIDCLVRVEGVDRPGFDESDATFEVRPPDDADGDGMDDAWEVTHFGNLDRDGSGDYDGDGHSDLDEFLDGTDPAVVDAADAEAVTNQFSCATAGRASPLGATVALALVLIAGCARRRRERRGIGGRDAG